MYVCLYRGMGEVELLYFEYLKFYCIMLSVNKIKVGGIKVLVLVIRWSYKGYKIEN